MSVWIHARVTLEYIYKDLERLKDLVKVADQQAAKKQGGCCWAFLQVYQPVVAPDVVHCLLASELHLVNARSSVYLRIFSREKVGVFLKGGTARKWEEELDATENKLRNHLDILVKSETIAGYTRDRAREHSFLTRYLSSLRPTFARYAPFDFRQTTS